MTIISAAKCFSPTNLCYIKRFYELFSGASEKLPQAGAESGTLSETTKNGSSVLPVDNNYDFL